MVSFDGFSSSKGPGAKVSERIDWEAFLLQLGCQAPAVDGRRPRRGRLSDAVLAVWLCVSECLFCCGTAAYSTTLGINSSIHKKYSCKFDLKEETYLQDYPKLFCMLVFPHRVQILVAEPGSFPTAKPTHTSGLKQLVEVFVETRKTPSRPCLLMLCARWEELGRG